MADTFTLYKLIILYLLDKVNFPMSNAQLSEFILEKEYNRLFHGSDSSVRTERDRFPQGKNCPEYLPLPDHRGRPEDSLLLYTENLSRHP